MEEEFRKFLREYEAKVVLLSKDLSVAYFDATISGNKKDYDKAAWLQLQLSKLYSDKDDFRKLKEFKTSGQISDPLLARQLELIYNEYASNQFDEKLMEEIIRLSSRVEEKFSTFRVNVNNEELTDNDVDAILIKSTDTAELEAIWKASKQIGNVVVEDVIKLAEMRNESARALGFSNYYEMSLTLSEQNPARVEKLFDDLDSLTAEAFAKLKNEIDIYLAARLSVTPEELMPWHYQDRFFQNGPQIYKVDLDSYFAGKDIIVLSVDYYKGIGLDIEDLVAKSDLFEKEGKYQHAYCTDIDREGDIRVVCNIKPNYKWMGTMLHEYGHAVYDKYIDKTLPWELRTHAHIFTTEAIAMFFGRLASNPEWFQTMLGISKDESDKISSACFNSFRLEQLVFSRWVQVMFRFEKALYENPGQDLNNLWWSLVEKYQMLKKPEGRNEPDWASKIHIALYPAYYHNYMLGELLASQFHFYILNNIDGKGFSKFVNNNLLGDYFKNKIFKPGAQMRWDELITSSTGEFLSPGYYALQIMNKM
jgi:peptidyl-dipeptidase A